jgi:uridine kinase
MMRARLLEQVADATLSIERPHPIRVAIDGMPAAGKSILADELGAHIKARGRAVIRASADGFHRPKADRYRRGTDSSNGYYFDAFDYPTIRHALLLPLGPAGNRLFRPASFDLRADRPINAPLREAGIDAVLLCDGVFLLRPGLDDCWEFRIFVQVDEHVAVKRARARDWPLFGSREATARRYWMRYMPAHRIYEEGVRPRERADVIVDNNDPRNPRLL